MGMTIDEAIEYNENLKTYMEINDKQGTHKFLEENHIALNMAIETMRKYQKIQEIYLKWNRNYDIQTSSAWTEVIEVLEDGNDD